MVGIVELKHWKDFYVSLIKDNNKTTTITSCIIENRKARTFGTPLTVITQDFYIITLHWTIT